VSLLKGGEGPDAALSLFNPISPAHKGYFLASNSTEYGGDFMDAKSALKVIPTDETNDDYQRKPGGQFAPGNKGGPGGSRPGSGRKPAPADETLLKRLYDLLDGNADKALGLWERG